MENKFDFSPKDLTDGREPLEWKTKYPFGAWILIICESLYISLLLFGVPIVIFLIWLKIPHSFFSSVSEEAYKILAKYVYAWLGAFYGGIIIDLKWLYHSVSKKKWHVDRILWRILEPHLSASLGLIFMFLLTSGLLNIFDQDYLNLPAVAISIGILVGLFSDNATGKLAEIASKLFGASKDDCPRD